MDRNLNKKYQNRNYCFYRGMQPLTFAQLLDGSKAAYCEEEDQWYWLYFDPGDTDYKSPLCIREMSESEQSELEYHDIIQDIREASRRGEYAEVTDYIRRLLLEVSIRRQTIFVLNSMDRNLIKEQKGIIYRVSQTAIDLFDENQNMNEAVAAAIQKTLFTS